MQTECSVSVGCCAHLLVFCLVWLLRCPTLCALVHFVPCSTNLRRFRHVRVALWAHRASRLASLGRCTVHLQTPQLTALEAALVHDATWPPCVGAITCWFTCSRKQTGYTPGRQERQSRSIKSIRLDSDFHSPMFIPFSCMNQTYLCWCC